MAEFFTFLRTDPQFYAKTPRELLSYSAYVSKKADDKLSETIGFLPRRRHGIRPVPDALAPIYTGGRGGLEACLMNTYNLPARPLYTLASLTLHECTPGHSFQAALALEGPERPAFRDGTSFSGYGEGWGLYTEWLGTVMGIYETPYEDFGRLTYEMWRACRLVIDTGIHQFGWTREQAMSYLRDRAALVRARDHDRDRSLHRLARAGAGIQARRNPDSPSSPRGRREARREVRSAALPRCHPRDRLGAAAGARAAHDAVHRRRARRVRWEGIGARWHPYSTAGCLRARRPSVCRPIAAAQTRPGPKHRVILGNSDGLLLAPDGTLQMWMRQPASDSTAASSLGLGHNRPLNPFTLVTVPGLSNVVAASAGWNCTFAVLSDGRLLAWGKNPNGRLGTTTQAQMETLASWSPNESNVPIPLSTKFDAIDVSAGDDHALALARDGSVYAWGVGKDGQLGIGPMPVINFRTRTPAAMTYMPVPVRVPDLGDVTAISAGTNQSLALLKDGTVRAWGYNKNGEVGDGTTTNRDRPIPVPGVRDAVAVAACGMFSMALLANGTVMVWGARGFDNKPAGGTMPAVMPGLRGIKAIAGGLAYGVALTESGTVMTWGDDAHAPAGPRPERAGNPRGHQGVDWRAVDRGPDRIVNRRPVVGSHHVVGDGPPVRRPPPTVRSVSGPAPGGRPGELVIR